MLVRDWDWDYGVGVGWVRYKGLGKGKIWDGYGLGKIKEIVWR